MEKLMNLIDIEYVKERITKRPDDIHKGDCGTVLVVAGSKGMAGAAGLCAKAALRAGSGLVQVAVSDDILPIVQVITPEATCVERSMETIQLEKYDAVAFGPGLGVSEENRDLLIWVLNNYDGTLVLDADGLNLIAKYDLWVQAKERECQLIITPHIGEAKRLLGTDKSPQNDSEREEMAQALAAKLDCIALLKGSMTAVALDKNNVRVNATGNPGMATAGSGDVLTGVIASLVGQGFSAEDSAMLGAFIHGMAGDIMAGDLGEQGLLASDMTFGVALAMKAVAGED